LDRSHKNFAEGVCRLCLNERPLLQSHVLPKALYRYLRASGGSDPVSVSRVGGVHQSSKQFTAYLLCSDCEQRLNDHGERWMIQQGYRGRHRFRLRDTLLQATPLGQMHDGWAYSALNLPGLDVARIAYYSASVFWRASLCSSNDLEHHITLGKRYEEEFRQYLAGCAGFPSSAALVVQIANTNAPLQLFSFPFSQRHAAGCHQHSFFAQGVLFWLFVGGRLLPKLDRICIVRSREQIIFLSDKVEEAVHSGSIDLLADALGKRKVQ
jgi:hypothetical protein